MPDDFFKEKSDLGAGRTGGGGDERGRGMKRGSEYTAPTSTAKIMKSIKFISSHRPRGIEYGDSDLINQGKFFSLS